MGDGDAALDRPGPAPESGRPGHAASGSFLGRRGARWPAPLGAVALVVLGVNVITVASASAAIITSQASLVDGPLLIHKTVSGNQVNTSKLPVATLYWRVSAVDSNGPGMWSTSFQLTVT